MTSLAEHVRAALEQAAASVRALEVGRGFQERWLEDSLVAALETELPHATVLARRRPPGFEVPGWQPQPGAVDVTVMRGKAPWGLLELKIDDVQHSTWDIVKLACAGTIAGVELACVAVAARDSTWKGQTEGVHLFEPPGEEVPPVREWEVEFILDRYRRSWSRMLEEATARPVRLPARLRLSWLGGFRVPAFAGYELRAIAVQGFGGEWVDLGGAENWYETLRDSYRPDIVRVLLIGESPPDPGDGGRRFFYAPTLSHDNLYRGVAEAVYGETGINIRNKEPVLDLLKQDGFWLIDAVQEPINKARASARRKAIERAVPALVDRVLDLAPEAGVVICHSKVYEIAAPSLRSAGVRILHDSPLPFPLGNWRAQFVRGLRQALETT